MSNCTPTRPSWRLTGWSAAELSAAVRDLWAGLPRWRRRLGRTLAGMMVLAALLVTVQALAWDPERIVQAARGYSPRAELAARQLQQAMALVLRQDEPAQLVAVNDFFNRHIVYADDMTVWGQEDYWASPLEALDKGRGDCEDYAIAKYMTLTSMGVPHARLRLVYVRAASATAPNGYIPHMVLAWYATPDADPLVLDNLIPEIRRASARPDLTPVFSFNADGLWQGVGSIRAQGDPQTRLTRWRDVLQKARRDGFQ